MSDAEYQQRYRETHRAERKWKRENPEKVRASDAKYRKNNAEKIRERTFESYHRTRGQA